jgi:hypothetical protein
MKRTLYKNTKADQLVYIVIEDQEELKIYWMISMKLGGRVNIVNLVFKSAAVRGVGINWKGILSC